MAQRYGPGGTDPSPGGRNEREIITGAQATVRALEALGVTDVFGMPGGAILPTYDPLMDSSIRHILVRHEQGGGHAAAGFALASGKVGVCIATSGPGATNLLTALADANMDSVPLVAITGQVGAEMIGSDAFQEADIVGASMPLTKHSFLITKAEEIPARIAEAFHIAATGRPGPVLVDITKTAQVSPMEFTWPPKMELPGYRLPGKAHSRQVKEAARLLTAASRPVIYAGGGVIRAEAAAELSELSAALSLPVTTTLTALGAFPESNPLNLGMPGMHGTVAAVGALQKADVILAVGTRFDDRVTGKLSSFAPEATIIHIDIDAAEISKNRVATVPVVGDAKQSLQALLQELPEASRHYGLADTSAWRKYLQRLQTEYPLGWVEPADGKLSPQEVIAKLAELADPESIFVTGVGQHQMWAAQFLQFEKPRHWLSSCGLGTMGFGVPAGMGAKVACPDKPVWVIDGDGCFQMTNQELATCAINDIPIKIALINNSSLGMVRQWQTLFYSERYSNTELHTGSDSLRIPDFVKLAEAYGVAALRCERAEDVDKVLKQAMEINDRPVLVEFVVSKDAMVWPMVPAGVSNDQIMHARDLAPQWDEDE